MKIVTNELIVKKIEFTNGSYIEVLDADERERIGVIWRLIVPEGEELDEENSEDTE